ncbi:MAG: c-type cytochrome [Gemmatimonadales bacterium]
MDTLRRNVTGARMTRWALEVAVLACVPACGRPPGDTAAPTVEPAPSPSAPVAAAPTSAPEPSRDKLLVTETEYQGWRYYHVYCERCHGPDALGTLDAPDLRYSVSPEGEVTPDSFRVIVRNGTENREMKGFEDLLEDQRIDQIYAYVKARSEERLAAGRPQRASGHQ